MSRRPDFVDPSRAPRVRWRPIAPEVSNDGTDAVELASSYGLTPDLWQQAIVCDWLGRRADGKWCAGKCGIAVPRQNGKNGAIEVRELFGMVVLGEKFLHTAHQVKTARKAFKRILSFFDLETNKHAPPELVAMVVEIRKANGQEAIFLNNGGSIEFVARQGGSGRGFTVDVLVLDEAQDLEDDELEALLSTVSSAPLGNPQVIYAGTPPNRAKGQRGTVFTRVRKGAGTDGRLSWIDFGAPDGPLPDLDDVDLLYKCNPALGLMRGTSYALQRDVADDERTQLSPEGYARERLGWWGDPDDAGGSIFGTGRWPACALPFDPLDPQHLPLDVDGEVLDLPSPSALGIGVSLDLEFASLAASHILDTGRVLLSAIDRRTGTAWIPAEAKRIQNRTGCAVLVDEKCPDPGLLQLLLDEGVNVTVLDLSEWVESCTAVHQEIADGSIAHTHHDELDEAVGSAAWRSVGDGRRAFGRRASDGHIDMLEAATCAHRGAARELDYDIDDSLL